LVLELTFLTINVNNAVFGGTYLLNSVALSIVSQYAILPTVLMLLSFGTEGKKINDIVLFLDKIHPYNLTQRMLGATFQPENLKIVAISFAFVIVVYLIPGFLLFNKREIY
ncbi:MAG: hypothetical protein Q4G11_07555, partial [Gallicola sp.]|nr:hypothetical protein [Gallicola sp.]